MTATLLMIDNYDSFTYNLVQMFRQYDLGIHVYRSDKISVEQVENIRPDYIVISPGPKDPEHAGVSVSLIRTFYKSIPILGVCLGMQCINEAFGGRTVRAPLPMHGKTSMVRHENNTVFKGMASPFTAARYHSLMVELPFCTDTTSGQNGLEITAVSDDQVIMGLSHRSAPLHGVQFHPESFLTQDGFVLVENFLAMGVLHAAHNQ